MSVQDRIFHYNIKQTRNGNKENYQLGDSGSKYQIFCAKIIGIMWETVRAYLHGTTLSLFTLVPPSPDNRGLTVITFSTLINSLIPMSDQDRISPYNINAISSKQVTRI